METLVVSSENRKDIELIQQLVEKMGLKSRLLSDDEKEDLGLLYAMLQTDPTDMVEISVVMEKLQSKDIYKFFP